MTDQAASRGIGSAPGPRLQHARLSLPLICGAIAAITLLILVPSRIAQQGYLNHVSGSWAALADDFAHGVLYRPLVSELGYGGTRNFPLHILLHGWLVRAGLSLLTAGHLVSVLSACIVVVAGTIGLSRHRVPMATACAFGVLALASRTAVMGAAGIRGDLLPVALGVLGLALTPKDERQPWLPAAIFLALALLAKPTLVWAPAGSFIALVMSRKWLAAIRLSLAVGAFAAIGILGAEWLSHGQMLASFRACASGGGFSAKILANGLSYVRAGDVGWIIGGVAITLARGRKALTQPFCAAALICLPLTIFVLTSRGTHINHLVDGCALGALAIGAAFEGSGAGRMIERALVVITFLGLTEAVLLDGMPMRANDLSEAVKALPPGNAPLLSEQPWIPLLNGERAFSMDAYNLLQTRRVSPQVNADLLDRLDQCRFRAIVLLGILKPGPWYEITQFGVGFRQHVLAHYSLHGVFGAHALYLPNCGNAPVTPDLAAAEPETILERGGRPSEARQLLLRILKHFKH